MDRLRDAALRLIVALNVIALVVSFGESFYGLYEWAVHHGVAGFGAAVWPLMVDIIILVGESGLFVAHHGHWRVRDKVWLWFVTLTALAVSAGGNIGHVVSTDWLSHLTAALPPAALFFSMTVGFGIMKRTYLNKPGIVAQPIAEVPESTLTELREKPAGTVSQPRTEFVRTGVSPVPESPDHEDNGETTAAETVSAVADPDETSADPGMKVIPGKSFTLPPDRREGLKLPEKRVRDMLDVDPDISANAVMAALGISRATAYRYLQATREARGLA